MGFLVILKDISIQGKRVHREGIISCINTFQFITTMVFCFMIALCIILLGLFISDRMKFFLLSREDCFYILPDQNNSVINLPSDDRKLSSLSSSLSFEDWVAPPENLWHSMSDEELMWRAFMAPKVAEYPYNRTPKVEFMFLARGILPLGPLWEMFFKGHDPRLYSIYLHCSPEFTEEPPESSVFYKRSAMTNGSSKHNQSRIEIEMKSKVKQTHTTQGFIAHAPCLLHYGSVHPFLRRDISETFLNQIRYDSGNCSYTGNRSSSYLYYFLFARKFHPST
ncbi:hypothetical protein MKX03_008858 [Papaver bracteatum]|nr:hypothetical protein MKX03_008858 [Papaver bracteatum]